MMAHLFHGNYRGMKEVKMDELPCYGSFAELAIDDCIH